MTEKEMEELMAFAKSLLGKPVTREEAIRDFVSIGVMDMEGNFTPEYKVLEEYFTS